MTLLGARSTGLVVVILPGYLLLTLAVGWWSRRRQESANAFLNASHSLPLHIVTAAYLAANCGALEMVGMSAMAAQYGVQAFQFYLIGAIPALIFLSLWMLPVYARSGATSIPAYLERRYGPVLRLLNACVAGVSMLLLGGVSLYAVAQVLGVIAGLDFGRSVIVCGGSVLAYVLMGGLRATIYNEVLQLGVMLAGLAPLTLRLLRMGALRDLDAPGSRFHLWQGMPLVDRHAPGDVVGWVFGLGFVLSFGYWCTDFVQMQRAFAARTGFEARQVPLWAGFGKLVFAMLVVLPGLAAARVLPDFGTTMRADQVLPALMKQVYGTALLGLGLTALVASLMSGLASNASGFASIWTEEIYRPYLRRAESEQHYVVIGRIATSVCVAISCGASYLNFLFGNLMEHVQLIFSLAGAPFWAIFLLAVLTRRTNERGASIGFLAGTSAGLLHLLATGRGWLPYASRMSANFHMALISFTTALIVGYAASGHSSSTIVRSDLVFHWRLQASAETKRLCWLATALLMLLAVLNIAWW